MAVSVPFARLQIPHEPQSLVLPQLETAPWQHPFLTADRLTRFRDYSEAVWAHVESRATPTSVRVSYAFAVNLAQNMYKWARLAQKRGANATLYLNPQDQSAISRPEWEEFDGEFADVLDGGAFLREHPAITVQTPWREAPNEGSELLTAYQVSDELTGWQARLRDTAKTLAPDLGRSIFAPPAVKRLAKRAPTVRHAPLLLLKGLYPYFAWAELLAQHDVIYAASTPFPAYASGRPYCVFSVGGDLQFDCGRDDDYGRAMRLAFAGARFILASNPHTLGHCRRFGLSNALYLPYPMDTDTYHPGEGHARREWIERFGGDTFVLTSARIDRAVKGHTDAMVEAIAAVARQFPHTRFLFLSWGATAEHLKTTTAVMGMSSQMIVLPPVGKRRLIDYYRSCDLTLDQFVYGYLGATALEAAAVGKPVVMHLRAEQYAPLYRGDVPPVEQAETPGEVARALGALLGSPDHRRARGRLMREWVVRAHGEQRTVPLLLALLAATAHEIKCPRGLDNPLLDPLSDEERAYQEGCRQQALRS